MSFVRVYRRVLQLLWPERWLAVVLVIGNLGIACITFLEPILFGAKDAAECLPPCCSRCS